MSEVPPKIVPPEPPPQFVQYPRGMGANTYGTVEQLQALGDGYFGLNRVFVLNIVLAYAIRPLLASALRPLLYSGGHRLFPYVGISLMVPITIGLMIGSLTYPLNRKIAFGKAWPDPAPALCSLLMGINSALFCGIIGFMVMQHIASTEIKRYGLTLGYLGIKKRDFYAFVENMRGGPDLPRAPRLPEAQWFATSRC